MSPVAFPDDQDPGRGHRHRRRRRRRRRRRPGPGPSSDPSPPRALCWAYPPSSFRISKLKTVLMEHRLWTSVPTALHKLCGETIVVSKRASTAGPGSGWSLPLTSPPKSNNSSSSMPSMAELLYGPLQDCLALMPLTSAQPGLHLLSNTPLTSSERLYLRRSSPSPRRSPPSLQHSFSFRLLPIPNTALCSWLHPQWSALMHRIGDRNMLVLMAASEAVLLKIDSGRGRRKRAYVQISGGPRQACNDSNAGSECPRQKAKSTSNGGGGHSDSETRETTMTTRKRRRRRRRRQQHKQEDEDEDNDERMPKVPAIRPDDNTRPGPSRAHLPRCSPSALFVQSVLDEVPVRAQWRARQKEQWDLQQQQRQQQRLASGAMSSTPTPRSLLDCVAPDSCLHWPTVSANDLFLEIFEAPIETVAAMHAPPASLRAEVKGMLSDIIRRSQACRTSVSQALNRQNPILRRHASNGLSLGELFKTRLCTRGVARFCYYVVLALLGRRFVGNAESWKRIRAYIHQIIDLHQRERETLSTLLVGLSPKSFSWMTKATRSNSSLELDRLRTIMLTRTVYWLFTTIVIPSVRRAFYVTTSNDTRGKLEFFTWANWYKILKCAESSLVRSRSLKGATDATMAAAIASATGLPRRDKRGGVAALPKSLPIASLQILPKLASQSFRPIAMFKSKRHASNKQLKANLKICLMSLQAVIEKERERVTGAGISAIADAANKLMAWKKETRRRNQQGEDSLFLVKIDIKKAFDNLRHDLIMEAAQNALDELKYPSVLVVSFLVTSPKPWNRAQSMTNRKVVVCLPSEFVPFPELAKQVASRHVGSLPGCSIVHGSETYELIETSAILNVIERHVRYHHITLNGNVYHQCIGTPQGSIISVPIFDLALGLIENKYRLLRYGTLLRFVDDYLLLATSPRDAENFVEQAKKGLQEVGLELNVEKSMLSFQHSDPAQPIRQQKIIPWCGLAFDSRTGQVLEDYSKLLNPQSLRSSLTLGPSPKQTAAQLMPHRLWAHFTSRSAKYDILLNPQINSKHTILVNVFQMLCAQCCKALAIFASLSHPLPAIDANCSHGGHCEYADVEHVRVASNCRYLVTTLNKHFAAIGKAMTLKFHARLREKDVIRLGWKAAEKVIMHSGANCGIIHKGGKRLQERLLVSVRLRIRDSGWLSREKGGEDLNAVIRDGWPIPRI